VDWFDGTNKYSDESVELFKKLVKHDMTQLFRFHETFL